jgi:hypothetical protein
MFGLREVIYGVDKDGYLIGIATDERELNQLRGKDRTLLLETGAGVKAIEGNATKPYLTEKSVIRYLDDQINDALKLFHNWETVSSENDCYINLFQGRLEQLTGIGSNYMEYVQSPTSKSLKVLTVHLPNGFMLCVTGLFLILRTRTCYLRVDDLCVLRDVESVANALSKVIHPSSVKTLLESLMGLTVFTSM